MNTSMKMVCLTLVLAGLLSCTQDRMKREQLAVRSELEHTIADVDYELNRVKREADTADGSWKEKLDGKIDRLEDVKSDLSDNLGKVGDTKVDDWDAFRRTVNQSVENANDILKESRREIAG